MVELNKEGPLKPTSRGADGTIMGISHESFPLHGIQFHPESFMTEHGFSIIDNFLRMGPLERITTAMIDLLEIAGQRPEMRIEKTYVREPFIDLAAGFASMPGTVLLMSGGNWTAPDIIYWA